jgi:dTDP-glucose 4,6-dehydratase
MEIMNILITGCKGTIGVPLSRELKSRGHTVFGIDLAHSVGEIGYAQQMSHEENTYERCDISEYRQLERLFANHSYFDLVYNCAAEFGRWNGEDYYEKVWKTNCIGLKHLLTLQLCHGFKLIHFSSAEVYGNFDELITEDVMDYVVIKQMNDYAISKWANELQILNHQQLNPSSKIVRLRLFDTYGPEEYYTAYRSVCSKFIYHALKGLPITVFKGHTRCGVYITDMVKALANISTNFINGRIYNLANDNSYTIEEMTDIIWDYTGASKNLITYKGNEKSTTITKTANSDLAKTDLFFNAATPLDEGIHKTVDWMREWLKSQP